MGQYDVNVNVKYSGSVGAGARGGSFSGSSGGGMRGSGHSESKNSLLVAGIKEASKFQEKAAKEAMRNAQVASNDLMRRMQDLARIGEKQERSNYKLLKNEEKAAKAQEKANYQLLKSEEKAARAQEKFSHIEQGLFKGMSLVFGKMGIVMNRIESHGALVTLTALGILGALGEFMDVFKPFTQMLLLPIRVLAFVLLSAMASTGVFGLLGSMASKVVDLLSGTDANGKPKGMIEMTADAAAAFGIAIAPLIALAITGAFIDKVVSIFTGTVSLSGAAGLLSTAAAELTAAAAALSGAAGAGAAGGAAAGAGAAAAGAGVGAAEGAIAGISLATLATVVGVALVTGSALGLLMNWWDAKGRKAWEDTLKNQHIKTPGGLYSGLDGTAAGSVAASQNAAGYQINTAPLVNAAVAALKSSQGYQGVPQNVVGFEGGLAPIGPISVVGSDNPMAHNGSGALVTGPGSWLSEQATVARNGAGGQGPGGATIMSAEGQAVMAQVNSYQALEAAHPGLFNAAMAAGFLDTYNKSIQYGNQDSAAYYRNSGEAAYLASLPHAATGGFVADSGVAVIHKGETIVPAGQGGAITINVTGNSVRNDSDISELVRRVSRELQQAIRGRYSYGVQG